MADKSKYRMNLAAIRKVDPYAENIVDNSAHVAFYTFNSPKNEWEKTDIEGAFFIYRRSAEPIYSIFIHNRLNTTSFVEPITCQLEIQPQPPFILYRNERSRIRGFWFYNSKECERIGEFINSLLHASEVNFACNETAATMDYNSVDILKMLSKSQNDDMTKTQLTSRNVIDFFAAAKPATSEPSNHNKIVYNSLSVEQLEKQQRAKTPTSTPSLPPIEDTCLLPVSQTNCQQHVGADDLTNHTTKTNNNNNNNNNNRNNNNNNNSTSNNNNMISIAEVEGSVLETFMNSINTIDTNRTDNIMADNNTKNEDDRFDTHLRDTTSPNDFSMAGGSFLTAAGTKPALMPPTMFECSDNARVSTKATNAIASAPPPLSYTQFVNAFNYLMKHDTNFMQKLHEAYLKQFNDDG